MIERKTMRKRFIAILLLVAVIASSAFAYSNQQKVHSVDSGIYKAMETLYILAGKSLPSSAGPWSEAELQMMLDRIDRSSLPQNAQKYYDYVQSRITTEPKLQYKDNFAMQFGLDVDLELYYHTNGDSFKEYTDWFHSYTYRGKFLNFTFETWPTDSFYGYFSLALSNGIGHDLGREEGNRLYKVPFTFNIPILDSIVFKTADSMFDNFNWSVPDRAFAAIGGQQWSFMAGRDKLSWGNGETGNLMLSDSFPVHTMARFNTFFDVFKYSMVATIYPFDATNGQYDSLDGYKAMLVHRVEFNLFNNKVGFALNEACMFWSNPNAHTGAQDFVLAQVNPFGFMHNEYIPRNANSLLVFEANYTPVAGLNIYGQFAVDEFSGPGEGKWNPAAFGFLAGVKGAIARNKGIVTGSLEFAKTDPYLYIRGLHYDTEEASGYGYDAIYRSFNMGIQNARMFTTYTYGNDVILVDGKAAYEMPGVFKAGFEALYMMHGTMDINSRWGMYQGNDDPTPVVSTPSEYNVFDPADYNYETHEILQKHPVETRIVLSFSGEYQVLDNLSASLAADFIIIRNKDNVADNNQNDVQITAGIRYSI